MCVDLINNLTLLFEKFSHFGPYGPYENLYILVPIWKSISTQSVPFALVMMLLDFTTTKH